MGYRIEKLVLANGETIALGQLTILVGANNSGKSQTLIDLRDYTKSGRIDEQKVIKGVEDILPSEEWARSHLVIIKSPGVTYLQIQCVGTDLLSRVDLNIDVNAIGNVYQNLGQDHFRNELFRIVGPVLAAHLGAEARFGLAASTANFDRRTAAPTNALQAFFAAGTKTQDRLRSAFKDAFGMDIAVDWTSMINLQLRVANDFGAISDSYQAMCQLMEGKEQLANQGDGYKSFAGVMLALLTFPERLLLLDEPEAFLHPAQARVLGRLLAGRQKSAKGK